MEKPVHIYWHVDGERHSVHSDLIRSVQYNNQSSVLTMPRVPSRADRAAGRRGLTCGCGDLGRGRFVSRAAPERKVSAKKARFFEGTAEDLMFWLTPCSPYSSERAVKSVALGRCHFPITSAHSSAERPRQVCTPELRGRPPIGTTKGSVCMGPKRARKRPIDKGHLLCEDKGRLLCEGDEFIVADARGCKRHGESSHDC
jgi:hypothetical protein